jgi:tetratricopeptide (TPR) repeat protein
LLEKERAPARLMADVNYWLGRVNYYNDRLTTASKFFHAATKQDPGHVDAYFFQGLVQLDNSQWRAALESFQKATELDQEGGQPDAWYFVGEAAYESRRYATAERAYEKYIKLAPTGAYVPDARNRLRELN